ncbi:MAG: hypothetical protein MK213_04530, partial [Planctomycetes bacterium]|nr:hypothetical protein [Planctomycetota bacterium]
NLQGDRRAAGLTLLTPEEFSPPAPEVIEALAATDVHEVEVYGDEARPDWDPNWRPKPFSSNSPRGGLGGFTAFNSTGWVPPDPNLAVGQDHIVGVVNSQISFFKKDGTQTYTKSLSGSNGFWGAQGAGSFVFDPIAVYSPHHDRYVVAAAEDTNNNSYVLIAVSDDNDPNGTWHKYRVFATSCGFLDFPNLGIDEDAVYVSGDCFSGGGNNVWIFPLQPMLTGANMTPTKVNMSGSLLSLGCFKNYDSGMDAQYFASAWTSNDKILFYALEDPLGSVTKHSTTVTVSVRQSPPGADQLGTSNKADTIDNRIKHGMYRNGRLWLCHNVGAGPGGNTARVRWYEFDMRGWPTSGSQPVLIQEGTLNYGSQEHNWFGDIHVDDAGNAVIAYHRSSPTQYIEIEYVHRLASDPLGTMRAEETLQVSTRPETGNRWGDYSGVEEDPSHPGTFWNHHEYRSSSWKTWMGHFAAVQNPVLSTTALIRGWPAFLEVEFAEPNELVHFAYSVTGTGSGPCYGALGGLCLDILNPVKLAGNATSNQNGDAVCQVTVPSQAPLVPVYIQAVIMRGVNGVDSVKSNVATETIQ